VGFVGVKLVEGAPAAVLESDLDPYSDAALLNRGLVLGSRVMPGQRCGCLVFTEAPGVCGRCDAGR
jgi:hypothetical protein